MARMSKAEYRPNFPIDFAIDYNFYCRGVKVSSSWVKSFLILPMQEESPTTKMSILPYPVRTFVPLSKIGEGISCF